ncbi:MAG: hypothetical protein ACYDDF_00110 [Thermoplasmatota archaeon]
MAGFWSRLESWIRGIQADRTRAARVMMIAYWLSVAFVALGVVIIFLAILGVWRPPP